MSRAIRNKSTGKYPPVAIQITQTELAALAAGEDKALNLREFKARLNVKGNSTVYAWIKKGLLPPPRKIGLSKVVWLLSTLKAA